MLLPRIQPGREWVILMDELYVMFVDHPTAARAH